MRKQNDMKNIRKNESVKPGVDVKEKLFVVLRMSWHRLAVTNDELCTLATLDASQMTDVFVFDSGRGSKTQSR
jgi:hypothetical protein